jgi:acetolactate synthase-1/2/3 large subunit
VNRLLDQSDLVIALGCKFSHNGTAGYRLNLPEEKLIHVDASYDVLNANYPAMIAIEADVLSFAQTLSQAINGGEMKSAWSEAEIRDIKSQHETDRERAFKLLPIPKKSSSDDKPHVMDALRQALPSECVIVTDSGLHPLLLRTRFRVECARGLVAPSDFQSMGYGAPAAVGAKVARPGVPVVLVVGDGGMLMSGVELATAVRENLQLLVLLVNDNNLGQIRIQQLSRYGRGHATKTSQVDFEQLARGIGANYILLSSDYASEFERALAMSGVTIVELRMKDTLQTQVRRSKAVVKEFGRAVGADKLRNFIKRLARFSESG